MNTKIVIAVIAGILVVGGGSFYAGTKFAGGGSRPDFAQIEQGGQMRGGPDAAGGMQNRQGAMGGGTTGEIIAKDDTSITVKLADGSSRVVTVSSSTSVSKMTSGSATDLVIGENVVVMGTTNSDGSVSAQSIQLGDMPNFRQPPGSPVR